MLLNAHSDTFTLNLSVIRYPWVNFESIRIQTFEYLNLQISRLFWQAVCHSHIYNWWLLAVTPRCHVASNNGLMWKSDENVKLFSQLTVSSRQTHFNAQYWRSRWQADRNHNNNTIVKLTVHRIIPLSKLISRDLDLFIDPFISQTKLIIP